MIPATADGAAREAPGAQLGVTAGASAAEVEERKWLGDVTVDGENGAGIRLDVDHMIVRAAVLVGVLEGAPSRRERQSAVPAREISEVRHGPSIAGSGRAVHTRNRATFSQRRTALGR